MEPGAAAPCAGAADTNSDSHESLSPVNLGMNDRNRWIWLAGAFQNRCNRPELICERRRFEWRGITALVQRVMLYRKRLVIVIAAAGNDPRNPTEHDLTNAQISALVISRQSQFRRNNRLGVYLEYPGPTLLEVRLDLRAIVEKLRNRWPVDGTCDPHACRTPSPIVSLLLRRET